MNDDPEEYIWARNPNDAALWNGPRRWMPAGYIISGDPFNPCADPNVEAVREKLKQRSGYGLRKYGTDTTRTDMGLVAWLTALQEELLDAAVYIERLKKELPK